MKKYVIYSILVGQYDTLTQPLCVDDRFDYILFSNDFKESNIGVWQIRSIPIPKDIKPADNKRLSRYPKTHPETMLSEYECSLYIDANIQITDTWVYNRVIELAEAKVEYAGVSLEEDDCLYEHAYHMAILGVEHDYNALNQCRALYKRGYPRHNGMNENNIIFRRHTQRMKEADELCWWWIMNYSFRDQFSYMYVLWEKGINTKNYFLPKGERARNSSHFNFTFRKDNRVGKQKYIKRGFNEWLRYKCSTLYANNKKKYMNLFVRLCAFPYPCFAQTILGWLIGIWYSPILIRNIIRNHFPNNALSKK